MTQYKDIPQPTDNRNVSQGDLLHNFEYLLNVSNPASIVGILPVDHKATGDNSANPTDGFHGQVSMLSRVTPTNLTNAINSQASDGISFVKNDAQGFGQLHHFTKLTAGPTYVDYQVTPCMPMRVSVIFNGAATIQGTAFNVASVTRNSTGIYTIVFTNPLVTTNVFPHVNCLRNKNPSSVRAPLYGFMQNSTTLAGSLTVNQIILNFTDGSGNLENPLFGYLDIYGG